MVPEQRNVGVHRPYTSTLRENMPQTTSGPSEQLYEQAMVLSGERLMPDNVPRPKSTVEKENVLVADTEKTFWQRGEQGFGVRLNEVDAHPVVDSMAVLLRFVFKKSPRIVIDKDTPNAVELHSTVLRMPNGLRVKYNGMFLDICGMAVRNIVLAVETPSGSFRLAIKPTCVEINETTFLTDFGLVVLPKHPSMISAPPQCSVSVIGEEEDMLRVRYKENRYVMKFVDEGVRIEPFEKMNA